MRLTMVDHERERHDALQSEPPKINPRYYQQYPDVVARMGVEWFERQVKDWEADNPVKVKS